MRFKKRAIDSYDKAIEYFTKRNNEKRLMQIHSDIGNYLYKNNQIDDAERHLKLGLKFSEKFQDDVSSIKPKYFLGQLFLSKGAYEKAQECFSKVISYCLDNPKYLPNEDMLQGAYYFSGNASILQGKTEEALLHYKNAVSMCDTSHNDYRKIETVYILSEIGNPRHP